ncbi:peptide-binding protein, partial [candidate division KSB1 bacterium]
NTIEFKFSEPYAPVLHKLGTEIIPKHLLDGKDLRQAPFARNPIGTGAYVFKEWRTDQYIILNSNHNYFEGRPYIDRYVMRVIPDEPVQYLELITGGIDYTGLSPYQYKYRTDTDKFKRNFNKYKYLSHSYTYVGYNLDESLFKDKKVRQALSYALNKKDIIQGALLGLGEVCTGPFLKGTYAYNESVEGYPYNPGKARALLKEAGWQDSDGDGILDKDGKNFSFRLILAQGNMQCQQVATIIQQQWKDIGIEVEIRSVAWATFLKEFVDKRNYQALILGWTTPVDPDIYNVWHSDSTKEGGLNFMNYKNKEVDKLIEEGRRTFNQAKRAEIYKKIHALISEDAPYTFLYTPYALPAVHKRFRGIEPAPAGIFYNFIDWYVPYVEQRYKF